MKTSSTFSILFWADFSRVKDNKASLYARITVNGKRSTISLKRKVLISDWDVHKNKSRGTSQKSRVLNSYLDKPTPIFSDAIVMLNPNTNSLLPKLSNQDISGKTT